MSNPRDNTGSRERTESVHGAHPAGERDKQRSGTSSPPGGAWRDADRHVDDVTEDVLDDDALNVGEGELAEADGAIESGGQHAGMGRGEKPRKPKSETK